MEGLNAHVFFSPTSLVPVKSETDDLNTSSSAPTLGMGSSCKLAPNKLIFSPYSPMDTMVQQARPNSTSTTPRRRLSLNVDENAQSPLSYDNDLGYCDSLVSNSSYSALEASLSGTCGEFETATQSIRAPLGEIKPSSLNSSAGQSKRKTLLARRLTKRLSSSSCKEGSFKENVSIGSPSAGSIPGVPQPLKFPRPSAPHRPSSLPTLSPLTRQHSHSPQGSSYGSCDPNESGGVLTRSFQGRVATGKSLMRQISSPLERMSLMSPTGFPPISHSHSSQSSRPLSTASSVTESDGYFSEVFEDQELSEDTTSGGLSAPLTTLINGPATFVNKPVLGNCAATDSKNSGRLVCPTPVRPSFKRQVSWCQHTKGEDTFKKRGSLKRSSPCSETMSLHRTKRPPLPFIACSNSQDSPPKPKALKGTPLLRSQSCCMPPTIDLSQGGSPLSPIGAGEEQELIGDFSRCFALPLFNGNCRDLKCITPETLFKLLNGDYREEIGSYTILDCRYPYEFNGGHIQGAVNIWERDSLLKRFFSGTLRHPSKNEKRSIAIFHCEFSSKRGPSMIRFLRETDRKKNGMDFPKLYYPEIYLLDGGYKAFYEQYAESCEPQTYCHMTDENYTEDLKNFKQRSKSWNGDCNMSRRRAPILRHRRSMYDHTAPSTSAPSHSCPPTSCNSPTEDSQHRNIDNQ